MAKLTKREISHFLAKKYKLSQEDSTLIVDSFFTTIVEMSRLEGGVLLKNFGKFTFLNKTLVKNIRDFKLQSNSIKQINTSKIHFIPSKNLKNF